MTRLRHVVLVGLMGSGKSSIGVPLAERLGLPYVDNDDELERRTGRDAREIATAEGPDALHRAETVSFVETLARDQPAVMSAPASVVLDPDVRNRLRDQFVVWLDTDVDALARRLEKKDHRPEIDGAPREYLARQRRERAPLYREVASCVVQRRGNEPKGPIIERIASAYRASERGDPPERQ
jgi:shikimate kinase